MVTSRNTIPTTSSDSQRQQRYTSRSEYIMKRRMLRTILLVATTAVVSHARPDHSVLSTRDMQQEDFTELNSILKDVVIEIPVNPPPFSSGSITMDLYNIVCRDFQLGSAVLASRRINSESVELQVTLSQLDFSCTSRYNYKGALGVSGRGDVMVATRGNQAVATATVSSTDPTVPPTNVVMNSCNPTIEIVDINFANGGIISWVLDMIEGMLRNTMERLAEEAICLELESALQGQTKDFLAFAKNMLDKYSVGNAVVTTKDLQAREREVEESADFELLNLRQQETEFGQWVNKLLLEGVKYFETPISTPDGGTELQVNQLLRDFVLDTSGALVLDQPEEGLPVVEVHDMLTRTTFVLDRVKLVGLDTLTRFDPFTIMTDGNYTLQTTLGWEYLGLEVDTTVTIRPSTRPDSVIVDADDSAQPVVEHVNGYVGVRDLVARTSLLAAVDKTSLENLRLGSLLSTDHAMNCLLSTIQTMEFTSMTVEAANVLTPSLSGLIAPGIDRVLTSALDAAFLMFETSMLKGAPSYFQQEIRPLLNQRLLNDVLLGRTEANDWACPPQLSKARHGRLDFRDLFLPPDEALILGGSGEEQYGDVISGTVMPYLRSQFLVAKNLNANVVGAVTKKQSGQGGVLDFYDVYEFQQHNSTLFDMLTFKVSKVSVSNIDTVSDPIELLTPTSGNTLVNHLSFGGGTIRNTGGSESLNITIRFFLEIDGEESPIRMKNEIDYSISTPYTSLTVGVLANFNEGKVLDFPLEHITNPYCWLSAIERSNSTLEAENGQVIAQQYQNLAISTLSFALSTFFMDSVCVQASSPVCESISTVIRRLQQAGFVSTFRESLVALVEETVTFLWDDLDAQELVNIAPRYCPHSNEYDPQKSVPLQHLPALSGLSTNSSETLLALGFVAMEAAVVISAKNQLLLSSRSPQQSGSSVGYHQFPEGDDILDLDRLSQRWGSWIDVIFEEFRGYVAAPVDRKREIRSKRGSDSTPRANLLLREFILDNSGDLVLDLGDLSTTSLGFSVASARIRGLDSITVIDPLVVVDSRTLKTTASFEELTITLSFDVATLLGAADEQIQVSYSARDVSFDIDVAIALNMTTLGKTQLGSIFDMQNIDSCLVNGVQALQIKNLNFSAKTFDAPVIHGFFSKQLQNDVSVLLEALHTEYFSDIATAVPLLVNSTGREVINAMIPSILEDVSSLCPAPPSFETFGIIDFRELLLSEASSKKLGGSGTSTYGSLFSLIYDVLDKEVMQRGTDNRPLLSGLVGRMTQEQSNTSGTIRVAGKALDSQTTMQVAGLKADLGIQISNVFVKNLDSIGYPLRLFHPVQNKPSVLNNSLAFGVDSEPIIFVGTFTLSLSDGAEMNIRNEVNISLTVQDVSFQLAFLVQILENSVSNFPFEDFSDWRCWLSTILLSSTDGGHFGGVKIAEQDYKIGNFSMDISCHSCTSPSFDELLMSLYAPLDLSSAIQEQSISLMEAGFLSGALEALIFDSKKRCRHHSNYDAEYVFETQHNSALLASPGLAFSSSEESAKPMYFNIANAIIAGCLCIAGICGKIVVARRNKKWMESLSPEGKFFFQRQQEKEDEMSDWLDRNTTSLAKSLRIPITVRWGVPFALLANIGLFMGGHLGVLSVVNVEAMLAEESFTIHRFMEFSFLDSTRKTYHNGGADMVVLIWIFTGIWPYVKLLLSLTVWMAPTSFIGVKRRGTVLLWIDALAKLSVVDVFTMLLGVAVFLVFIGGPDDSIASNGVYYALKAIVIPKAGCYCLLIAQRMSRVSSRFLLEYHDSVVFSATSEREVKLGDMSISQINLSQSVIHEKDEETQSRTGESYDARNEDVGSSLDQLPQDDQSSTHQASVALTTGFDSSESSLSVLKDYRWGYWGAVFGFVAIVLIFAIGCIFAPAIAFDLSTIAGLAVESGKTFEEAVSEYGVFVVVSGILVQAKFVLNNKIDYVGLGLLLSAVGISVSLIFIIQVYQFVKKMKKRWKRKNEAEEPSYGHDGCGLRSYFRLIKFKCMEIYLISFAIGVWQLGSITSYSMYLYCDLLTRIYDIMTFLGIAQASTTQCFKDQATNGGNLTIVFLSFLILCISFFFESRAQYQKNIKDCIKNIEKRDVPSFSVAWSSSRSKKMRDSHMSETLSIPNMESSMVFFTPPGSPGLSNSRSSDSNGTSETSGDANLHITSKVPQQEEGNNDESLCPSVPTEDISTFPIATPCSVACSSRHRDRSSILEANCEFGTPPLLVQPWDGSPDPNGTTEDLYAPPLMPSWSMEEDTPELFSSTKVSVVLSPVSSPSRRLSYFLRNHLPVGSRRSLPLSSVSRGMDMSDADENDAPMHRPRRIQSTEDILHHMEENSQRFS